MFWGRKKMDWRSVAQSIEVYIVVAKHKEKDKEKDNEIRVMESF